MARRVAAIAAVAIVVASAWSAASAAALPPVKHVFVIVLENKDYDQSFASDSAAPYLSKDLTKQGQLLTQYYGTSHASLGNYISMISGQAPNLDTQADCAHGFNDIFPGVPSPDGQVIGVGCVYPAAVKTVADQLDAAGLSWRGYMEDMGNDPSAPKTCRHPAIGEVDDTQSARATDQYATRHNPFVYFHSIIDDQRRCDRGVVPLDRLRGDLETGASTPSLAFITPDLCSDGHDEPCIDGRPGGLKSSDAFLREWVPRIQASPAYADGGLIVITWDEGNVGSGTSGACCNEPSGPNTPLPGIFGPGGGRIGGVILSPFTKPGSVNDQPYNHYALLRSIEDLFGLAHLGYAGAGGLKPFGADVFNALGDVPGPADAAGGGAPGSPGTDATGGAPGSANSDRAGGVLGAGASSCARVRLPRATRGRYPRGTLLSHVVLSRGRLRVTARHAASLVLRRNNRVALRTRLRACRTYSYRVGRGRLEVRAVAGGAREQRVLRS